MLGDIQGNLAGWYQRGDERFWPTPRGSKWTEKEACPEDTHGNIIVYATGQQWATVAYMAWVQVPVWSDYLCVRIISSVCFEINISDWQQASMVSSIICDCWRHLKFQPMLGRLEWLEHVLTWAGSIAALAITCCVGCRLVWHAIVPNHWH